MPGACVGTRADETIHDDVQSGSNAEIRPSEQRPQLAVEIDTTNGLKSEQMVSGTLSVAFGMQARKLDYTLSAITTLPLALRCSEKRGLSPE